ncbi:salt tolerance down-regulator-domain-containing protein [Xylaria palmicola]|nr:salt tolerance down-regulator-domain-containing protein [Xylaria palmicola]
MSTNNKRQPAAVAAASPLPKTTAKYTNKDGTKYISVPKSSASTPPAQPSPTTTASSQSGAPTNGPAPVEPQLPTTVNKKKQKRRAKAAAKAAAEKEHAAANGLPSPASTSSAPLPTLSAIHRQHQPPPRVPVPTDSAPTHADQYNDDDWGEETDSDDGHQVACTHRSQHPSVNGSGPKPKKSKKKKKTKKEPVMEPEPARPSGISREKIWNTSGPEERERIKQFWLGLGEDERKSLVKVEKDAVLRKMKEQQKHTCSCSVCGRKRTAIEEELEGLYDAYYQELESFANQPHGTPNGPPIFAPKRFGPMSGLHPPGVMPSSSYSNHHPSRGRIVEHVDNEEDELEGGEEEYSDGDDLEEVEDEDEPEEIPRDTYPNDFFNFGQSLTVKGAHAPPFISLHISSTLWARLT